MRGSIRELQKKKKKSYNAKEQKSVRSAYEKLFFNLTLRQTHEPRKTKKKAFLFKTISQSLFIRKNFFMFNFKNYLNIVLFKIDLFSTQKKSLCFKVNFHFLFGNLLK